MAVVVGTGTTVTFAGTAIGLGILSLALSDASRPAIDSTVLTTTVNRESIAGNLKDLGTLELELLMDAEVGTVGTDLNEFYATGSGALVITFPGSDTYTVDAICTAAGWNVPLEDRMTANLSFKLHTTSTFAAVT